jgi:hypothetical protein
VLKKAVFAFFFVCMLGVTLNFSVIFADHQTIAIKIDGQPFVAPEGELQSYIIREGRIMLQIRLLAKALSISDDTQHISWDRLVNEKTIQMDTAAENKKGRVYLPLRYIAEALGFKVAWVEKSHTVHILTEASNNLAQYNLMNISNGFPITIHGEGYTLTINDTHIYLYDSQEAKDLVSKYGLKQAVNGTPHYLVWLNVGIENTGVQDIGSDSLTNQSPFSFGFHPADEEKVQPTQPTQDFDTMNNVEVLYKWRLSANQSLQSHIALILTQKDIERYFVKTDKENIMLALRQS